MNNAAQFGVIVPIGPNPAEVDRAKDLIESLQTYEGNHCAYVVLIDDNPTDRGLGEALATGGTKLQVFVNPRRGRGQAWSDGLGVGVAVATNWLASATDVGFALRLDTDSLVIAPFADRLARRFGANPRTGLLGTVHKYPSGEVRDKRESVRPLLTRLMRPFSVMRLEKGAWPTANQGLLGIGRVRRNFIERATRNGYAFGDGCQGGGYALSRPLLDALASDPCFVNPFLFCGHTRIGEDVMMTIATYAAGFIADDFNQRNEVFGVVNSCLADSPDALLGAGYGIIHSVKTYGRFNEAETRTFFRNLRTAGHPHAR